MDHPTTSLPATLTLLRLDPSVPEHWVWWPLLEARVRQACPTLCPLTPPEPLIGHLRQLWASHPMRLGAFLFLQDDPPENGQAPQRRLIGHAVGWLEEHWGVPYVLFQQVHAEETVTPLKAEFLAQVAAWSAALNALYALAGLPLRIRYFVFLTDRPETWQRYFRELPVARGHTALVVPLPLTE